MQNPWTTRIEKKRCDSPRPSLSLPIRQYKCKEIQSSTAGVDGGGEVEKCVPKLPRKDGDIVHRIDGADISRKNTKS